MMDSPEDKGAFMTKTKRARNRVVVQRRQSLVYDGNPPPAPLPDYDLEESGQP